MQDSWWKYHPSLWYMSSWTNTPVPVVSVIVCNIQIPIWSVPFCLPACHSQFEPWISFFFFCFIPSWFSLFYGSYSPTWKELSIKVHIVISYWTNVKWVIWKSSFFFHFCSNWFSCSSLINQMPFHCLSSHPVRVLAIFFILFLCRDTSYNPWPAVALCPCASVLPQNGLDWKRP